MRRIADILAWPLAMLVWLPSRVSSRYEDWLVRRLATPEVYDEWKLMQALDMSLEEYEQWKKEAPE